MRRMDDRDGYIMVREDCFVEMSRLIWWKWNDATARSAPCVEHRLRGTTSRSTY